MELGKVTWKAWRLRRLILSAVRTYPADALMLSGGIDSSILAAANPKVPAYTAVLQGKGSDIVYAQEVARYLQLNWYPIELSNDQALEILNELVVLTESFDPGLLNDIPLYAAMRMAGQYGAHIIRTGDFADTLFQGYEYMWKVENLRKYLDSLLPNLTLASERLGTRMGFEMNYPFLDPKVVRYARRFRRRDNLVTVDGTTPGDFHVSITQGETEAAGYTWGKITLRRAAIGLLPATTVFRIKTDLEYGSGMYTLEEQLAAMLTEKEVSRYQKEGRYFWNRMHIALFSMFLRAGLRPNPPINRSQYTCQWCGAGVVKGRRHCLTCGAYPADTKGHAIS